MDINKIKDKIKKLIALSQDNPNDEESYSALTKAQALMAQYKIEESEIKGSKKEECLSVETKFRYSSTSSDTYLNELATILADNFCCINYVTRESGKKTRNVCFMGFKKDLDIVLEAMNVANGAIVRGYTRVRQMMCKKYGVPSLSAKYFNPAKLGYIRGYLQGLKEVLESQKNQIQEWGLVLVAPKEAQDFVGGLSTTSYRSKPVSDDYFSDGYADGKNFQMNKKINPNNITRLRGI